jgi:hypothetical protein
MAGRLVRTPGEVIMRSPDSSGGALRLAAMLGLCLLAATPLHAQTTSASVFGSVVDTQGGLLPGATVTLTSRTQAYTLTATSDSKGDFVFPIVRPDVYTLRVSMEGFKTLERTSVVVNANDKFSTGVLTLEVGAVTEEVSVTGRVSELQAASGERSYTVESATIQNIANDGRSLFGFATLTPGVVPLATSQVSGPLLGPPEQIADVTVNGQRPNSNNMTIDGVANIDTGNNGGFMATTNIDAVSEFKILTNAYQAEYGRAVGGQVQVVTKSGTQSFHGSGYWYGRRSGWNANTWTNTRAAAPPPVGIGQLIEPSEASRNDFGYTIGGPVFIPGKFNTDKTKLFFFWSQEWQKRQDSVAERLARVPTELERRGDFSQSVDSSGNPWPYIRDWTTGLPCSASDTRGCFQDGGVLGRIPQDRLWPPGLNALSIYPLPNTTGSSGINYRSQTPGDMPRREEMLRLDFQATDRWRFMGRYMRNKDTRSLPYGAIGASSNLDTLQGVLDIPGRNWMLSATGILNATTSIEISVGSAHNEIDGYTENPALRRSAAGLTDVPLLFPEAVQEDYIPTMLFNGGRVGPSAGFYYTTYGPFRNENTTYDVLANLTRIRGSHSLKAGVYYQHSYKAQTDFASHNSGINFVDDANNPYDTGFGYANAAIGVFDEYSQASKYAMPEWVYDNFELYVQDNWKATRRLTLDYGVRFYYLTPNWDQTLQASTFLPDRFSIANAARLYSPVCLGSYPCSGNARRGMDPALVNAGATPTPGNTVDGRFIGRLVDGSNQFNGAFQAGQGIGDTMQSGNAFRVSPRIGVVYDLTGEGRTILRGGFGTFYDRPLGNMVYGQIANAPGMLQPSLQWGRLQDVSASQGDPDPTLLMQPTAYDFDLPHVMAWNVGVQHKLGHSTVLDLAYVGSSSKGLLQSWQINAIPWGAKFLPENQDPTRAPSATPGGTALPDDLLRPYSGYNQIYLWGYGAISNYHALQTSLNRRFDNGLMFSVFYVWSKALGTADSDYSLVRPNATEEENRRANYSYLGYDRPYTFVVNFIYQTPRVARGPLGLLANGWQISGVYRWMSGTPYPINFFVPGIGDANLTGSDQPARIVVTCDPGKGWSGDPYQQIDPSCFAAPQPGSDGMESARYFVHGPPVDNLDLSLSKSFAFGKGIRLEVRLDAFNALNHTQFTGVNNTAVFASLSDSTIVNPAYDTNGNVVRNNGFGTISGVRPARTLQLVTRLTF